MPTAKSKSLSIASCSVCCTFQKGCLAKCVVCHKMAHSSVGCSFPDPTKIRDGKTNEDIRVCRKCICGRCKMPLRLPHACVCVWCKTATEDNEMCSRCMQPIHSQKCATISEDSFICFKCVTNRGNCFTFSCCLNPLFLHYNNNLFFRA